MWSALASIAFTLCLVLIQIVVPNRPKRRFEQAIQRRPEHYAEPINTFHFGLSIGFNLFLDMLFNLMILHRSLKEPV